MRLFQPGSKKGTIRMSTIEKLQEKLEKLKASSAVQSLIPSSSGWLSRKLWVALAIVATLVIVGRENINIVLNGIITLGMVYIIAQGVHDIVQSLGEAYVRGKIVTNLAKDGLTVEEIKAVNESKV